MKSADVTGLEELDKLIKHEASLAKAYGDALEQLKALDLADAPDEVQAAQKTLVTWLEERYGYSGNGKPNDGGGSYPAPTKSFANFVRALWERVTGVGRVPAIEKALGDEWPAFCQRVAGVVKSDASTEQKSEQLTKAVNELEAKVKAAVS